MSEAPVSTDLAFALLPEWLLDADVSAQAIRLYAVLARYADRAGNAFPSRKALADRLQVRDKKTVDRALKELVDAQAVTVHGRVDEAGDQTSNHYVVHRTPPEGVVARTPSGGGTNATTQGQGCHDGGGTDGTTVVPQKGHEREPLEREPSEREEKHLVGADAPPAEVPPRDDVERLCAHLADRIEANGSKRPTITRRWRDAARLLLDRDNRTEEQVVRAIDWCQADEFWRSNILSMPKLREKYDQLRLAAQRASGAGTSRVQDHLDLAARLDSQYTQTPTSPPGPALPGPPGAPRPSAQLIGAGQ